MPYHLATPQQPVSVDRMRRATLYSSGAFYTVFDAIATLERIELSIFFSYLLWAFRLALSANPEEYSRPEQQSPLAARAASREAALLLSDSRSGRTRWRRYRSCAIR